MAKSQGNDSRVKTKLKPNEVFEQSLKESRPVTEFFEDILEEDMYIEDVFTVREWVFIYGASAVHEAAILAFSRYGSSPDRRKASFGKVGGILYNSHNPSCSICIHNDTKETLLGYGKHICVCSAQQPPRNKVLWCYATRCQSYQSIFDTKPCTEAV